MIGTIADFIIYTVTFYLLHDVVISKCLGFVAGSVIAYLGNKFFTFTKGEFTVWEIIKFSVLYCNTLLINVFINKCVFEFLLQHGFINSYALIGGFVLATIAHTIINFIGQKFWVFR